MSTIKSAINTRGEDFKANADSLRAQVEDLRAKAAQVSLGGRQSIGCEKADCFARLRPSPFSPN